jgi:hypothetical protein
MEKQEIESILNSWLSHETSSEFHIKVLYGKDLIKGLWVAKRS